jgi:uncharacterized protein (TIGR02266 family)
MFLCVGFYAHKMHRRIDRSVMIQRDKSAYSTEQKDQRSTLRVPLIVEKLPCGDGRRTFFGYARNLSRGGVFISTVNPREPGEQFDLHLTLPPAAGLTLVCRCEVVWRRQLSQGRKHEPGMGLRFLNLSQETADALECWLRSIAPQ